MKDFNMKIKVGNETFITTHKVFDDECVASGESCSYELESIPSEYVTGECDGAMTKVLQCKYCGKKKE